MDAKITKARLSGMLSYDWLKIIGLAAALILIWVLIFTMTATRITPAQQFTVYNYAGNVSLSAKFGDLYDDALKDGVFSYEVIEHTTTDLTLSGDEWATVLQARVGVDEGDLMFIADAPDKSSKKTTNEETGEVTYERTYLQSFLNGYRYSLYNLDPEDENSYFRRMEKFLIGYFGSDWENGALNEAKAKADFRTRVKKDKRYKKESQLLQGEKDELARLESYRAALKEFNSYLDAGYVQFTEVTLENDKGEPLSYTYYLNLCPETDKDGNPMNAMDSLVDYMGYKTEIVDENGETRSITTAKNMNVAFFNLLGADADNGFQYESLLFVNHLIETVLANGAAN